METYSNFASVYDIFMDQTPYEQWCDYLIKVLRSYKITKGIVLDLGCGTGTLTQMLQKAGYDMIGIDNSVEMLQIAVEKWKNEKELQAADSGDILYLQQDMREFELYGTVAAIISVCDSLNYLLKPEELVQTFSLVNNYLDEDGIFIFDFNTVYKYREIIGDQVIAENREECSFIWENYYYEEEHINEYDVTIFIQEKEEMYRKFIETHYQRGYTLVEMKEALIKADLKFLGAYDVDTQKSAAWDSERIYIIAQKAK